MKMTPEMKLANDSQTSNSYCVHCGINFDYGTQNRELLALNGPLWMCKKSPNKRHDHRNIDLYLQEYQPLSG